MFVFDQTISLNKHLQNYWLNLGFSSLCHDLNQRTYHPSHSEMFTIFYYNQLWLWNYFYYSPILFFENHQLNHFDHCEKYDVPIAHCIIQHISVPWPIGLQLAHPYHKLCCLTLGHNTWPSCYSATTFEATYTLRRHGKWFVATPKL